MMPALAVAGLLLLASPSPSAVPTPATDGSVSITGGSFTVRAGEVRDGDVSVLGGSVDIEGQVTGDVTVTGGNAVINGTVGRDVVVLGGTARLGPASVVGEDVSVLGGSLDRAPGARIGRDVTVGPTLALPGLRPLSSLVLSPVFGIGFGLALAGGVVLLALLLQLFLPGPVATTRAALEERPFASLGFGCLTTMAGVLLALLLGITILLLPVSLAIAAAMGLAWLLGLTGVIVLIGERLTAALRVRADPVPSLLIGGALVAVLVNVPILGGVFGLVIGAMALGAVVLTRFGTRPHPPVSP